MLGEPDFAFVTREVKTRTGIVLGRDTNALAETRLIPLSRREGFASVSELIQAAKIKADGKMWGAIAEALIQSDTRFFRDRAMFARLREETLPDLFRRRAGQGIRIWCAGAGGGQEAYSLAMLIDDLRNQGFPGAEIIATDISERLLDKARSGLYTQFEVQRGLPIRKLIAHFEKTGDLWRISDRQRAAVRFEPHNLLQEPSAIGPVDLVLCCNVINGFDAPTRAATIERIGATLMPGGVLILGEGEQPPDGTQGFVGAGACLVRDPTRRAAA
jgi:chemotaxis protein methyltransferase CheR